MIEDVGKHLLGDPVRQLEPGEQVHRGAERRHAVQLADFSETARQRAGLRPVVGEQRQQPLTGAIG
jgi:hypothetical protein